jgi:CRP/FNR family cyclic AMP-dependent transcriptional regulator
MVLFFVSGLMTFATMRRGLFWGKFLFNNCGRHLMSSDPFESLTLFQDLDVDQGNLLRSLFLLRYLPAGTELFKQGEQAEYLYVVIEGEIHIRYKPEDGPALIVARVQREGVVGWSAAIGSPTYTSSAICVEDSQLLCTRSQDLRQLCEDHRDTGILLLERLAAIISERLKNAHQQVMAMLEQGMQVDMENLQRPGN